MAAPYGLEKTLVRISAVKERFAGRSRVAAACAAALALVAGCTPLTPDSRDDPAAANAALWQTIRNARVIDLSHTWDKVSPIASVNPPYAFELAATHGKTRGTFNDNSQLSFTSEVMKWGGQHGAPSIDAIGHIGRDGKLFGGLDAAAATSSPDGIDASGAGAQLAIDNFPNDLLINRGVLRDVARLINGDARPLPASFEITAQHLKDAAQRQRVQLRKGDTVFINTGWAPTSRRSPTSMPVRTHPGRASMPPIT
jgi:kynurenine formamidase